MQGKGPGARVGLQSWPRGAPHTRQGAASSSAHLQEGWSVRTFLKGSLPTSDGASGRRHPEGSPCPLLASILPLGEALKHESPHVLLSETEDPLGHSLKREQHLMKFNDELKGLFPPPLFSLLAKSSSASQTWCRQRLPGTFLLLSSQPPQGPFYPRSHRGAEMLLIPLSGNSLRG